MAVFREKGEDEAHQLFRLGARDEHVRRDAKRASEKLGPAQHVLHGTSFMQLPENLAPLFLLFFGQMFHPSQQHVGLRQPEAAFGHQAQNGAGFAPSVEFRESVHCFCLQN